MMVIVPTHIRNMADTIIKSFLEENWPCADAFSVARAVLRVYALAVDKSAFARKQDSVAGIRAGRAAVATGKKKVKEDAACCPHPVLPDLRPDGIEDEDVCSIIVDIFKFPMDQYVDEIYNRDMYRNLKTLLRKAVCMLGDDELFCLQTLLQHASTST